MLAYSIMFSDIRVLEIIKAYSDLFRQIQHPI